MEKLNKEYVELLSGDEPASKKFWALEERIRLESAIIYHHRKTLPKGIGNTKNTKTFPYDETTVMISGEYTFGLSKSFVQPRVDTPAE